MLGTRSTIKDACDALVEADRLIARALEIIGGTDVEAACGLPTEMMLALGARRTGGDARMLVNAAQTLRGMPATAAAFSGGELSWSQVRQIVFSVRTVDRAGRARIDQLISEHAARLTRMDPDELLARVDDAVSGMRQDLARAREDRQTQRSFIAFHGRLDGSCAILGEADAESTATILEALDAAADPPVDPEADGAPSRGHQHLRALVGMCEDSLGGGGTDTTRPRPRLIATVDIESLREGADSQAARILWSLAGRPARITPLSAEVLGCDATVTPVIFQGARPVAVGDVSSSISSKLRAALVARDGGCRFPSCGAPVSWCDAHHVRARIHDGPTVIDNLLLLCRQCHRRVHRKRITITMRDDGVIEFRRNGETFASSPRIRPRE